MSENNDRGRWAARWKVLAGQYRTHYRLLREDYLELATDLDVERARTGSRDETVASLRAALVDARTGARAAGEARVRAEQRIRELEAERDELRAKVEALTAESKRAAASELLYENTFEALTEVCDGNDPGPHLPLVHVQRAKAAGVDARYAVGYYRGIHDALVSRRGIESHSDEDVAAEFVRRFEPARIEFGDEYRSVAAHWGGSWESWGRGAAAVVDVGAVDAIIRAARLARGE